MARKFVTTKWISFVLWGPDRAVHLAHWRASSWESKEGGSLAIDLHTEWEKAKKKYPNKVKGLHLIGAIAPLSGLNKGKVNWVKQEEHPEITKTREKVVL
jgi:hypothetical protein